MMLAEVASTHHDISTVEIHHDRANRASARVAAKAGFVFAGERRDGANTAAEEGVDWVWRHMDLPGFRIRPERPQDHEQIKDVVAAAFDSPVEAKLVDDIRSSPEYIPEFALVAEVDSEMDDVSDRRIIGHVMISGCELLTDGVATAIKMLSPLAVHPDWHRRGVGGALVKAAVDRADEAEEPLVIVEGDPAYYNRFGFGPAMNYGITINVPDWAPPEAGQVIRLGHYDPDLTGTVVYPKAFDGID
jgi:putative acetyltransferase